MKKPARAFLRKYANQTDSYRSATSEAGEVVKWVLTTHGIQGVSITSRPKTIQSSLEKIRRKDYGAPVRQLTDLIGVRVLTFYRDEVDEVAAALRQELEVDERRSPDKRADLGLREFGYRSVHLVARQKTTSLNSDLSDRWFEVQVRSLLEHAWAEIEHEVVYKGGVDYPRDVRRRFSALAGTIEILDREFLRLRANRNNLIEVYRGRYSAEQEWDEPLDTARLAAAMEVMRPSGRGWREAERLGKPFAPHLDVALVDALRAVGVSTAGELREALASARFRGKLGSYASSQGIAGAEASHLAVGAIAAWTIDAELLESDFPELQELLPPVVSQPPSWLTVQIALP